MDTKRAQQPIALSGQADPARGICSGAHPAPGRSGLGAIGLVLLLAGCQAAPVPTLTNPFAQADAPRLAVGEIRVYRLSNGYNNEVRGQFVHQVEKIEADRAVVSITPDRPSLGQPYTEVSTMEGNWLRRQITSHDQPVVYEFATAYPAYVRPFEPGKSWSVRVNATDPATGRRGSVRVDGKVLGAERIRVPAGEFDTIKIRRYVYTGDWDYFLQETTIDETDWYAPALGRPVRMESESRWKDLSRCNKSGCPWFYGDWNVYELVALNPARAPVTR